MTTKAAAIGISSSHLAEQALDAAVKVIHDALGVTTGDLAGRFFSDGDIERSLEAYIDAEIDEGNVGGPPASVEKPFAVVGRIICDDNDSCLLVYATDRDAAIEAFKEEMARIEYPEKDLREKNKNSLEFAISHVLA